MAKNGDNDDQRADNQSQPARVPWGSVSVTNLTNKCREQAKLGQYPKRRSDDEY